MPQTSLLWLCSEEVWGGTRALKAADSILYENMSMCLLCIAQIGKFGFIFTYIADWYGHWYIFFRIIHENWNLFMCVQMWTTVWGWTLGLASNSFPHILLSRTVEVLNRTNRNNKCVSEADKLICLCFFFYNKNALCQSTLFRLSVPVFVNVFWCQFKWVVWIRFKMRSDCFAWGVLRRNWAKSMVLPSKRGCTSCAETHHKTLSL